MTLARRDLLLALGGPLTSGQRFGSVAFHYGAVFNPEAVDWYTRFRMLVTGAVLPSSETTKLRRNGTRLIAYEWSSGFYPGDASPISPAWEATVRKNSRAWLLSPDPVEGGSAEHGHTALWYDFGEPAFIAGRADYYANVLKTSGYDGVFFDTAGFEHLPTVMQAAFQKRHPDADYNQCQGAFFGALRQRIGSSKVIFLNQGYRHADEMLPFADFDLTESYFTAIDGDSTRFRKWHDPQLPWESIRTPMEQLVMPAARKFPHVRFVHANYAGGGPALARRAARYSWACAKLWDHQAYLIAPGAYSNERDEIYFTETGAPKTDGYQEAGGVVQREFEKGVVELKSGQGYFYPHSRVNS
jgi:hypothetical protein